MFEKILERLEEVKTKRFVSGFTNNLYELGACHAMDIAKEVVKEVAKEYEGKTVTISVDIGDLANSVEYGVKSTGKDGR